MLSVTMYGRFGNQLWQYAVCRTVAEKRGFSYHIPREFQNYFGCTMGDHQEIIQRHFPSANNHDHIQRYDPKIFEIEDGTKIDGYHQSEKYILDNRENILNWFRIPQFTELYTEVGLDSNTCVINFRGGDYSRIPHVFLHKKFWDDSIERMKEIKDGVRFIVVTDDPGLASEFFPNLPIYHFGIMQDLYLVSKAEYLIIANSTFSWWGAWLNENTKMTIAPKYWMRYNVSDGWWSPSDSLTTRFHYVDRDGKFQSYEECLSEIDEEYNYFDHYHFDFKTKNPIE